MEFSKVEIAILRAVASVLKDLREDAGFKKPTHFAKSIGMDPGQYGRYENWENMKLISLIRLLTHHNLSVFRFIILVFKRLKDDEDARAIFTRKKRKKK
ncbi:MAG: hypothetical protein AB7G44_09415 [Bacteroidia bacterium]